MVFLKYMLNKFVLNSILKSSNPVLLIGKVDTTNIPNLFNVSWEDTLQLDTDLKIIEEVRGVIHFLSTKPYNSEYKLVIINDVEKMKIETANTLLKTLEEPPDFARIILTTENVQKIIPTILSRCNKLRINATSENNQNNIFIPPDELTNMPISEKFKWVAKNYETVNLQDFITYYQEYEHQKLLKGVDNSRVLNELSCARDLLGTNISVKLLLENILLQYSNE
jgi:hypothetical protein